MSAKGFGFERCSRMAATKIRQTLKILREDSQLEGANSLFAALAPGLAPNAQVGVFSAASAVTQKSRLPWKGVGVDSAKVTKIVVRGRISRVVNAFFFNYFSTLQTPLNHSSNRVFQQE